MRYGKDGGACANTSFKVDLQLQCYWNVLRSENGAVITHSFDASLVKWCSHVS